MGLARLYKHFVPNGTVTTGTFRLYVQGRASGIPVEVVCNLNKRAKRR